MTTKLIAKGIWTPWAEVLCYTCHGQIFRGRDYNPKTQKFEDRVLTDEQFEEAKKPIELIEGCGVTYCTKCGADIQVDESLAIENNIVAKLRKRGINAEMSQTGGMNSACYVPELLKEGQEYPLYFYVTYNWDGDNMFMIGHYDDDNDYIDDGAVCETVDEVLEYFEEIKDKLQIIEK